MDSQHPDAEFGATAKHSRIPNRALWFLEELKETDMQPRVHTLRVALALLSLVLPQQVLAQSTPVLRDVKIVQVEPTLVANPAKVKDEAAPNTAENMLRSALTSSGFEIGESPIRAHLLLEEFSSGSTAKRVLVGFGSGRSTVAGRLIFTNADQKELASIPLKVRGNFMFSSYDSSGQQRKEAVSSFEKKLIEEIARLK
jgi:hypothetical protein